MDSILEFCRSQHEWALDAFEALARCESPSQDKAAVDRCGAEIEKMVGEIGGRVERLARSSAGDHLRAEFGHGAGQVLLLGHFDTVWPVGQIDRMPIVRRDGRLHGPGTFDMKAGIVIGLLGARALFVTGSPPANRVVMLLTTDEEIGSRTSRDVIEHEARKSRAVLVLEPSLPGGSVKTRRKGSGEFRLSVHGVSAHAGIEPEKGASAIQELARQILTLERIQDLDRGISVNVGLIRGGSRLNVVPDEATAEIDVRVPTMADASGVEAAFRALRPVGRGITLDVSGGIDRPPLERSPAVVRLYEIAREVAAALGHDLGEGETGGGSDGNYTAALGVPTLDGLGAIGDGAHALHEHVDLGSIPWRGALVAGLIWQIDAGNMTHEGHTKEDRI